MFIVSLVVLVEAVDFVFFVLSNLNKIMVWYDIINEIKMVKWKHNIRRNVKLKSKSYNQHKEIKTLLEMHMLFD